MFIDTSGGFEPSEVIEEAVKPIGSPEEVLEVITAIPAAWFLKTDSSASVPLSGKSGEF